jgi:hypothetical protein
MPKIAIDYSKTQMYKLKHKDDCNDENVYVGHTINWIQRKYQHSFYCNNEKSVKSKQKKYQYIRENGGWEEWEMIWIEDYPCNSKREAEAREEYIRCNLKAQLNSQKAFATEEDKYKTRKEWNENNKEEINEKRRENYENNKYDITCECGCLIKKNDIAKHRKRQKHIALINNLLL